MPIFLYKAKIGPEKTVEGKISAITKEQAVAQLSLKGYMATYVEEAGKKDGSEKTLSSDSRMIKRISQKDLISFTGQLAVLTRSGIPLVRGIDILSQQMNTRYFRHILTDIAGSIRDGGDLSSGLRKYSRVFSPFYVAMVRAGEESGALDGAFARLTAYYKNSFRLRSKIKTAMVYPLFIMVVGFLTLGFVFTSVMPRMIPVISSMGSELPGPTKLLIRVSSFIGDNGIWILLAVMIILLIFKKGMQNPAFLSRFSFFRLKVPLFGDLILKSELSRFTRALQICLDSGIPVIKAARISSEIMNEPFLKEKLQGSLELLEKGRTLTETLRSSGIFPEVALSLVNVGEETGAFTDSLSDISDSLESDCGEDVDIVISLLEPAMVLGVGLIVGFIVISVLLPVFEMNFIQM